jgi:hypothetical protein
VVVVLGLEGDSESWARMPAAPGGEDDDVVDTELASALILHSSIFLPVTPTCQAQETGGS